MHSLSLGQETLVIIFILYIVYPSLVPKFKAHLHAVVFGNSISETMKGASVSKKAGFPCLRAGEGRDNSEQEQ